MKTNNQLNITILLASFFFLSCTQEIIDVIEPDGKPGQVSGKIMDVNGKGLSDIKIIVEHTVWQNSYIFGKTIADGTYKVDIPNNPAGSWTVKAQKKVQAYGQEFIFDLDSENNAPFTQVDAPKRNFTWKLTGKKPNGQYYGAHIDIYPINTDVAIEKVKLELTPIEPNLIDGSIAKVITRNIENVAGTFMVKDVPIGKYKVKIIYSDKRLTLANKRINDKPAEEKTVVFGKNNYLAETEYNIEFWLSE
jgi:hypothetical protein